MKRSNFSKTLSLMWVLIYLVFSRGIPASADSIPERASIKKIKAQPQSYRLSCEARSAVDWAAYWGVKLKEKEFVGRLPRSDNPEEGFVGNIDDPWGFIPPASYGVHAPPVAELLREYGIPAQARKGMSWRELRREIAAGRPVIVWVIGQMWQGKSIPYQTRSGKTVQVANFEHTMILVGYDDRTVQALDAYSGQRKVYPLRSFLQSWKVLGNMAVVYREERNEQVERPWRVYLPAILR